jgi:hypothetical protein
MLTHCLQTHGLAEERHPSDGSAGSNGGRKKIPSTEIEMTPVDSSPRQLAAPVDPNAPKILTEVNAFEYTAYAFSKRKKWAVLTVVALCQTSMSKATPDNN